MDSGRTKCLFILVYLFAFAVVAVGVLFLLGERGPQSGAVETNGSELQTVLGSSPQQVSAPSPSVVEPLLVFGFDRTRFMIALSVGGFLLLAAIAAAVTLGVLYQQGYFGQEDFVVADEEARLRAEHLLEEQRQRDEHLLEEQRQRDEKSKSDAIAAMAQRQQQLTIRIAVCCSIMAVFVVVAILLGLKASHNWLSFVRMPLVLGTMLLLTAAVVAMFAIGDPYGGLCVLMAAGIGISLSLATMVALPIELSAAVDESFKPGSELSKKLPLASAFLAIALVTSAVMFAIIFLGGSAPSTALIG